MSHARVGSCDLLDCQIPHAFELLPEHERPGSTCFFFFRLYFYSSGNEEQQTFSQISSFTPSFDPKYSRNPFTFSHTKGQREWVACREHSKALGNLMLSGSRVQRPGRPNLLAIWNIIQKFNLHLMRWKKASKKEKSKTKPQKGNHWEKTNR